MLGLGIGLESGLALGIGLGMGLGIGLGSGLALGIGLGMGLGIGLESGFDYFHQYNVIRRIGIRRNGAEPPQLQLTANGLVTGVWRCVYLTLSDGEPEPARPPPPLNKKADIALNHTPSQSYGTSLAILIK